MEVFPLLLMPKKRILVLRMVPLELAALEEELILLN